MANNKGIYTTTKKDGSIYYRVSTTFHNKHISLGSFDNITIANKAYNEACKILDGKISINDIHKIKNLSLDKAIVLLNYYDNNIYFATPIYLRKNYFEYYLSENTILKFDRDDLFFYSSHKIQQKGGYIFVSDYGSQYSIQSRYGIKPFAVYGRDYTMVNNDIHDYRYSNINVINNFNGVKQYTRNKSLYYKCYIHINGNTLVGTYNSEIEAAVAYNKAVDTLKVLGSPKNYTKNFISSLSKEEYIEIYKSTKISKKLLKALS
ncbi:MAG: hypothetical protein PUG10_05475 [Lachnospiraceae bacterium]|nr:hypothetical protein [Lachnospiraceae bacterium]